jgi:hypothetical protein
MKTEAQERAVDPLKNEKFRVVLLIQDIIVTVCTSGKFYLHYYLVIMLICKLLFRTLLTRVFSIVSLSFLTLHSRYILSTYI